METKEKVFQITSEMDEGTFRRDGNTYVYDKKDPNHYDALSNIDLEINKGDFVCIVGKTGSGKSTLVQTFNSLILPSTGYTQVETFYITSDKKLKKELLKNESKEVIEDNKHVANLRKKVGMVFQFPEYQLFSETILKDVMFGPKNFGMRDEEAKEVAIKSLKEVGIPESYFERSPFELSGGEKRRVAIAGIIASSPDILVLDEPTAGLDPNGKKEIMALVKKIHETGKTVIIVTHDMDLVLNFANTVIVLSDAKLVEVTTPKELFNSDNLNKYSLEIPMIYKFINLLKNKGFAGNLNEINDIDTLIDRICEAQNV